MNTKKYLSILNLALCALILVLGVWAFVKSNSLMPLYVGFAFGLFGVSHSIVIADKEESSEIVSIVVRIVGYLAVALVFLLVIL